MAPRKEVNKPEGKTRAMKVTKQSLKRVKVQSKRPGLNKSVLKNNTKLKVMSPKIAKKQLSLKKKIHEDSETLLTKPVRANRMVSPRGAKKKFNTRTKRAWSNEESELSSEVSSVVKPAKVKKLALPKTSTKNTYLQNKIALANEESELSEVSSVVKPAKAKKLALPKTSTKNTHLQHKIALANEVANAQLVKKTKTLSPEYMITVTPINKKGKDKANPVVNTVNDLVVNSGTESEGVFEDGPKKRKYVRRAPLKTKQKIKPGRKPKCAENSSVILPSRKIKKQPKITNVDNGVISPVIPNNTSECAVSTRAIQRVVGSPRKNSIATPTSEIGKPENDQTPTEKVSPSLLEQVKTIAPNEDFVFESPKIPNKISCGITSRNNSDTSVTNCLSWTKDISSSSTTTCVSVSCNDFVLIDNKLPVLKIPNIDHKATACSEEDDSSSSSSSSSSSLSSSDCSRSTLEPSSKTPPPRNSSPFFDVLQSLQLSSTTTKSQNHTESHSAISSLDSESTKLSDVADLTSILNKVNLEPIAWMDCDNECQGNITNFPDSVLGLFKYEANVLLECACIKQLFNTEQSSPEKVGENRNDKEIVTPSPNVSRDSVPGETTDAPVAKGDVVENHTKPPPPKPSNSQPKEYENKFTFDRVRHASMDHSCDDDDALSLFAESITGIESSRNTLSEVSSVNGVVDPSEEEYIPQPISKVNWTSPSNINYVPSKIHFEREENRRSICEKQTADSTSISKDSEQRNIATLVTVENNRRVVSKGYLEDSPHINRMPSETKKPCLMSSLYRSSHGIKSIIFRGICFYNLISGCKIAACRFPHVILSQNDIKMKFLRLSEETFIQEYMLIRNWPILRRKYGILYVQECERRELTRFLVEMAIDFHMKANTNIQEDTALKIEVIELVLMNLNPIDLDPYEDLLLYRVQTNYLLCDVFMCSIAYTQNFSRFKRVFINLTNFMVRHQRRFNFSVASHILERLCILPPEQPLLESLLKIIENTDSSIFDHSMIGHLEKQLSGMNGEFYEKFKELKAMKLIMAAQNGSEGTQGTYEYSEPDIVPINPLMPDERCKRYTSPDTTNLDSMAKLPDEMDVHRPHETLRRTISTISTPSNDSSEEGRPEVVSKPPPKYQAWRGQSVFDKIRDWSPLNRAANFKGAPAYKRHNRFGHSPPIFPRRYDPDF